MFDSVKFNIHMTDMVCEKLQDESSLATSGTKIYGNKFYLRHPFKLHNPDVFINFDKRTLCIESSLPKLLQGHNVVGSNRLEYLCMEVTRLIYQQLGLSFNRQERRKVRDQRFLLGRVDGTCGFRLSAPQQVADAIKIICEQLRAEGHDWSAYGRFDIETVYNQQHSTRVTDKFYNKVVELRKNKLPVSVVECDYILEFARTLLRFEVTWRGKELKRLGRNYADQWSLPLLKEMMQERLEKFNFQGVLKGELGQEQISGIRSHYSMYYLLWSQGANLRQHCQNRTVDRARNHLLENHQVDIYRPSKNGADIPLREILAIDNAYFGVPKYLTKRGAIFGFGKTLV